MLKDPTKVENSGISAPNVKWPAKTKAAKMMKNTKKYAPNVPSATCMVCHTLENDALSCTKRNVDKKAKIKHKAFMLVMWLYLLNVPRDGKGGKKQWVRYGTVFNCTATALLTTTRRRGAARNAARRG